MVNQRQGRGFLFFVSVLLLNAGVIGAGQRASALQYRADSYPSHWKDNAELKALKGQMAKRQKALQLTDEKISKALFALAMSKSNVQVAKKQAKELKKVLKKNPGAISNGSSMVSNHVKRLKARAQAMQDNSRKAMAKAQLHLRFLEKEREFIQAQLQESAAKVELAKAKVLAKNNYAVDVSAYLIQQEKKTELCSKAAARRDHASAKYFEAQEEYSAASALSNQAFGRSDAKMGMSLVPTNLRPASYSLR